MELVKGVTDLTTKEGIRIWQIHYSADDEKDPSTEVGSHWLRNELMGYPGGTDSPKWRKEMEIDFESVSGTLVFPKMEEYRGKLFIPEFDIPETWSLYGGFDYATRGITAFVVYAKAKGVDDYYAVWEFYVANSGYLSTCHAIKTCPYYDRLEWIVADPQIWAANQQRQGSNEMVSVAQLFGEQGIHYLNGSKGGDGAVAERITQELWNINDSDTPRLRIFQGCQKLWWEMTRLRYADWRNATAQFRNPKETLVDRDNHAWDTLKYFLRKVSSSWVSSNIDSFDASKHIS